MLWIVDVCFWLHVVASEKNAAGGARSLPLSLSHAFSVIFSAAVTVG